MTKITQEEFDAELFELIRDMKVSEIIDLPEVYEAVSELLNNEVIDLINAKEHICPYYAEDGECIFERDTGKICILETMRAKNEISDFCCEELTNEELRLVLV